MLSLCIMVLSWFIMIYLYVAKHETLGLKQPEMCGTLDGKNDEFQDAFR